LVPKQKRNMVRGKEKEGRKHENQSENSRPYLDTTFIETQGWPRGRGKGGPKNIKKNGTS